MANKTEKTKREPLFHIVRRIDLDIKTKVIIYAIAVVGSFLVSALVCSLFNSSKNIFDFFSAMFKGTFGTERRRWILLQDFALLLGVSTALVPAFKMKFWNLGGNGQVLIACLSSAACMFYLGGKIPDALLIAIMFVTSIGAGIIWAAIPAIFKAFFNTNESLFTLMLNYIAEGLVATCIALWVKSGSGVLQPISYGNVPALFGNNYILTILVFVLLNLFMYVYLRYSKHGYELTVVGESMNTAKYVGINVKTVIVRTLILSGAIAGLVGFFLVGNINHTVSKVSANNMGFTAIMTSWLAAFDPLMMFVTCFFITFIPKGMEQVRKDFMFTNDAISNVVVGLVYFSVIACSFFTSYKIVFRKKEGAPHGVIEGKEWK